MHTNQSQAKAAANFARQWKGRGYERGEAQIFWIELLTQVFGVKEPSSFIRFEEQVKVDTTNFIDAHIPSTRVLIEQKSLDKDLRCPIVQSDGTHLTPFEQARRYVLGLPLSQHPRWIVVCNFREFLVYDMERPAAEPESILLENLSREYYRLSFLVDSRSEVLRRELEVSVEAGNIIGAIYDALLSEPPAGMSQADYLHALNTFCVRLVFCFYAEDVGVFRRNQFHDYLIRFHSQDFRQALIQLFDVLATPPERRDPFLEPALAAFPYVNGGLFASNGAALTGYAGVSPAFPGSAGASPAPIAASAAQVSGEVPTKAMTLDAGEAPALPGAPALPDWHNRGYLPHRDNVSYQSITFRLFDAVPTKLIKNWKELSTWSEQLNEEKERAKQARKLIAQYEDQGIGCCYLKNESIADIVQQTLLYDDGKVYDLIRWCIMPNHVHVLIKVYEGKSVAGIVQTWKSITTHKANKLLHRTGQLWMSDYFDRYIRNAQHYDNVIRYIDNNPVKAKLSMTPEEWKWSSAGYATLGYAAPGSAGALFYCEFSTFSIFISIFAF